MSSLPFNVHFTRTYIHNTEHKTFKSKHQLALKWHVTDRNIQTLIFVTASSVIALLVNMNIFTMVIPGIAMVTQILWKLLCMVNVYTWHQNYKNT